jgi:hypothetical protein
LPAPVEQVSEAPEPEKMDIESLTNQLCQMPTQESAVRSLTKQVSRMPMPNVAANESPEGRLSCTPVAKCPGGRSVQEGAKRERDAEIEAAEWARREEEIRRQAAKVRLRAALLCTLVQVWVAHVGLFCTEDDGVLS